jgi:tRNA G37 N-methylase Trm5
MSVAEYQSRNVPIQYGEIVPKDELDHTSILSNRISKKKIKEFAVQKYRHVGKVSIFLMKDCCRQRIRKDGIVRAPIDLTCNCRKLVNRCSWIYTIMQNVLLRFAKLYYLAK